MLSFITFVLLHNALNMVFFFLYIGLIRRFNSYVKQNLYWVELPVVGFMAIVISSSFRVAILPVMSYLFLLFLVVLALRYFFKTWQAEYRIFYTHLILTMFFYLLYKLLFLLSVLKPLQGLIGSAGRFEVFLPSLAGLFFFVFLFFSETFVLVNSAYAIHDSLILMAERYWEDLRLPQNAQICENVTMPMVSFHVPICNEPPEMVIESLKALAQIDYPEFEVLVISNNTKEELLWRPVEQACKNLGFKFFHYEVLAGYKAGALNCALLNTNEQAEFVCVVDADYQLQPGFAKRIAPIFQNSEIAFVQTSQDYRNRDEGRLQKMGYPVYKLFFDVVMVARNRRNSMMFAGTMGMIRRDVLLQIGGWNEGCVAEDAEASLRILNLGLQGVYLNETWGYGLMPTEFAHCEKQWARWMTGGIQVVRLNWKILLNFKSTLSFAQRWDYAVGGLMSFGAFLSINSAFLLAGFALALAAAPGVIRPMFTDLATALAIFSLFISLTGILVILTFKWNMGLSLEQSLGAFVFAMGLSWARARAVWLAVTGKKFTFERTIKFQSHPAILGTLWNARSQMAMLFMIVLFIVFVIKNFEVHPAGLLIIALWQGITYASGVWMSVVSLRRH